MSRLSIISVNTEDEVDKIIMNQLNSFSFPSSPKNNTTKASDNKSNTQKNADLDTYEEYCSDKARSYKSLSTSPQSVSSSDSFGPHQAQRTTMSPYASPLAGSSTASSIIGSPKSRRRSVHRHRNSEMISNDEEFLGSFSLSHSDSINTDIGDIFNSQYNNRSCEPRYSGTGAEGGDNEISFNFNFDDAYKFNNRKNIFSVNDHNTSGNVFLNNESNLRRNTVSQYNRDGLIDLNVCEYDFLKRKERTLSVPYNTFGSIKEEEDEEE